MARTRSQAPPVDEPRTRQQRDRDLRIDFFRGIALWFIFLDHIPSNVVSWLTVRNWGFSDATEIFVFISGYSAAIAYGRSMERQGFAFATASVWRRVWQLYVAHIVLFMFYSAQAAWIAARVHNPMYVEELNLGELISEPHVALLEALLLRFRPANLDVLPLYIVLMLTFPLTLMGLRRSKVLVLGVSIVLYVVAQVLHLNLPTYPNGDGWYFNPFAWQLLFTFGALCRYAPENVLGWRRWRHELDALAIVYLLFSLWIVLSWHFPAVDATVPRWLVDALLPVDKTNLDVLRIAHFLALAYLAARLISPQAAFLHSWLARPVIACGKQSLYVFCFGIYLSFASHLALVEIDDSLPMQVAISLFGLVAMTALAGLLNWYRAASAAAASARAASARVRVEGT